MKLIGIIGFAFSMVWTACSGRAIQPQHQIPEREIGLVNRMVDNFDKLQRSLCDFVTNVGKCFQFNTSLNCHDISTNNPNDIDNTKDIIDSIPDVINKVGKAGCYIRHLEEAMTADDAASGCMTSSAMDNNFVLLDITDLQLNLRSLYTGLTHHTFITPTCVNVSMSETNMLPLIHRYILDAKVLVTTLVQEFRNGTTVVNRPAFG